MSMNQKGLNINTSTLIDQLAYTYQTNSNKLSKVVDAVVDKDSKLGDFKYDPATKGSPDYYYDANGNLTLDNNKKISSITYNFLNLPSVITVTGKGTISYTYDAAGNKLKKVTVDNTVSPSKTTTTLYIGGAVYENDVLQFIAHEEGRIRPVRDVNNNITGFVYDYFLKDHLGNPPRRTSSRMVLTEEIKSDQYPPASMCVPMVPSGETAQAATEEALYANVNTTRTDKPSGYPNDSYTNPNNKVAKTNGSGNKIGPSIILKVMAGDKFNIRVSSWYKKNGATPQSPNSIATDLVAGIINSLTGTGGPVHGAITSAQLTSSGVIPTTVSNFLNSQPAPGTTKPKAYINWVLLDEQFKFVSTGSSAEQVGNDQEFKVHVKNDMPVTESGYLYVFVSNETPNIDVYFDNLQVIQIRGPILEETHYYPFGLVMSGISSRAAGGIEANKRFQGQEFAHKEFSDGSGLEMYEFKYRMDDPQTGRFWQIDPLADKYDYNSTYAFSENKVTGHVELEGLEAVSFIDANKNEHNKAIVTAANNNSDKSAVHVYAHGNSQIFYNENSKDVKDQRITTGATLNRLLNKMVPEWKDTKDHAGSTVVLHSCRTGRTTSDGKGNEVEPVAQKISASKEFTDVIIVAPTERDFFTSNGEEVGPRVAKSTDQNGDYKDGTPREKEGQATNQQGQWNVFKNGKLIGSYDGDWTPKGNPGWFDKLLHKN